MGVEEDEEQGRAAAASLGFHGYAALANGLRQSTICQRNEMEWNRVEWNTHTHTVRGGVEGKGHARLIDQRPEQSLALRALQLVPRATFAGSMGCRVAPLGSTGGRWGLGGSVQCSVCQPVQPAIETVTRNRSNKSGAHSRDN